MNRNLPLIKFEDVGLSYDGNWLFKNINFSISKGDKIILIGKNGVGKSSLLKMISGIIDPNVGNCWKLPGLKLSILQQNPIFSKSVSIEKYLSIRKKNLIQDNYKKEFELDIFTKALNLDPSKKINKLSGGEQRRLSLAEVLSGMPDVLLLDEPTNHLDIHTIQWLEDYLKKIKSALIVVSHDRAFLNTVGNRMFWIYDCNIYTRKDSFEKYEQWSEEIYKEKQKQLTKINKKYLKEVQWLNHGISARRKRNQKRLKNLEELRKNLISKKNVGKNKHLFSSEKNVPHTGKILLEAQNIKMFFEVKKNTLNVTNMILNNFNLIISKGDRIGVVGKNGSGKTTLLKILLKQIEPKCGFIKLGYGFIPGYFDQNRDTINIENTPLQLFCPSGGELVNIDGKFIHLRKYLKNYFLDDHKLNQKIKTFSGGEINKILLAYIFSKKHNFLVLDEPTNDLDIETIDLLHEIIDDYKGTVIIASHDRDFLDKTISKLIIFEEDNKVSINYGSIAENIKQTITSLSKKNNLKKSNKKKSDNKIAKKLTFRQKWDLENLPKDIENLENLQKSIQKQLFDKNTLSDLKKYRYLSLELERSNKELKLLEEKWIKLAILDEDLKLKK